MKAILFLICGLTLSISGLAYGQSASKDVESSKDEKLIKNVVVGAAKGALGGVAAAESGLAGFALFGKYIVKFSGPIFSKSLPEVVFDVAVLGAKWGSLLGVFLALEGDLNAAELDQLRSTNLELTTLRTQCF